MSSVKVYKAPHLETKLDLLTVEVATHISRLLAF